MQNRKVTYQLYESPKQALELTRQLHSHKNLWNAALEERIDAWKKAKKSIHYEDQCKSLTQIRGELPEDWANINCSSQQITLKRLVDILPSQIATQLGRGFLLPEGHVRPRHAGHFHEVIVPALPHSRQFHGLSPPLLW